MTTALPVRRDAGRGLLPGPCRPPARRGGPRARLVGGRRLLRRRALRPARRPDSNHLLAATTLLDAVGPVHSDHPCTGPGRPTKPRPPIRPRSPASPTSASSTSGSGPTVTPLRSSRSRRPSPSTSPASSWWPITIPSVTTSTSRITLTFAGIARARLVVFTVTGADKTELLGPAPGRRGPAGRPGHGPRGALAGR